jgi:hypothetical protein
MDYFCWVLGELPQKSVEIRLGSIRRQTAGTQTFSGSMPIAPPILRRPKACMFIETSIKTPVEDHDRENRR